MTLFIVFVCAIAAVTAAASVAYLSFVSAKYNGWRDLAESYRLDGSFPGLKVSFQSASLNEYSFPGAVTLGVSESGLGLKLIMLSHLFHPPLLIPWQDLDSARFETRFSRGIKLTIANRRFELELGEATCDKLVELTEPSWTEARGRLRPALD